MTTRTAALSLALRRALRRLESNRDRVWFQWFQSRRAFALFLAGLVALVADLIAPFTEPIPDAFRWLAEVADHFAINVLQFFLAVVVIIGAVGAIWRARAGRQGDMELRDSIAVAGEVKGVAGCSDDFTTIVAQNGAIALNLGVTGALNEASNPIQRDKRPYSLPQNLAHWKPLAVPAFNPLALNERKVGLRTEINSGLLRSGGPVALQDTDYLRDRTSNSVIVRQVWDCRRDQLAWDGRHCFVSEDGWLLPLDRAFASNQLGGSTLLIDRSWTAHFTEQTRDAAESPGLLAPTGSGSFDLRRLRRMMRRNRPVTFQSFARSEIERELKEETGLDAGPEELLTVLIGFGRYIYRGGKPEVFAISALRRDAPALAVKGGERLWTQGHKSVSWKDLSVDDGGLAARFSAPLAANVHLVRRFMASPSAKVIRDFLE